MKKYEITALIWLLWILICIVSLFYTIFTGNFPEQKYTLLFPISIFIFVFSMIKLWNKEQPDKFVSTPYYTWKECKYCHVVRPLSWEKCDCQKPLTKNLWKQDNYTVIDTWEIEK